MRKEGNIARCFSCNNKSHLKHWRSEDVDFLVCPCCDRATGYHISKHDGLSEEDIEEFRRRHNVDADDNSSHF